VNLLQGIDQDYSSQLGVVRQLDRKQVELGARVGTDLPLPVRELEEIQAVLKALEPKLKERGEKIARVEATYRNQLELLEALANVSDAWAESYRKLVQAVVDKRKLGATPVDAAVTELRETIKKAKGV
jgi:hypothetical protein